MKKERNSSIELLRLICMFFIILHHLSVYSDIKNNFIINLLGSFGNLCTTIFILISGFYLIKVKIDKNYFKKIVKFCLETFTYSLLICITLKTFNLVKIDINLFIKSLFPMLYENWFIRYYIVLLILIPFLNPFLINLKKENYQKILFILFVIWTIFPLIFPYSWEYSKLDLFIIVYFIGSYIRLYFDKSYKNKWNIIFSLIGLFLIILCLKFNNQLFINNSQIIAHNSPLVIFTSIFIFLTCIHFNFKNKIINYISRTTLGIYLIHENFLIRKIIWEIFFNNVNILNNFYLNVFLKIIIIYVFCILIAIVIDLLFDKLLDKISTKLLKKILKEK